MFGVVLSRLGGNAVDRFLRNAGLDSAAAFSLQLWIATSTLFATVLFTRRIFKKSPGSGLSDQVPQAVLVDGLLLLAWWITLIGMFMYAFMLGMAS
jgi:hypothetical protein